MFKCFKNQSDTYHDTQTHYLMEQDPLPLQDQAGVMDIVAGDMWTVLEEKRGPPGPCLGRLALDTPCLGTCGPRDTISLVIPRLGDNIANS
jgi:hypothetical protein